MSEFATDEQVTALREAVRSRAQRLDRHWFRVMGAPVMGGILLTALLAAAALAGGAWHDPLALFLVILFAVMGCLASITMLLLVTALAMLPIFSLALVRQRRRLRHELAALPDWQRSAVLAPLRTDELDSTRSI